MNLKAGDETSFNAEIAETQRAQSRFNGAPDERLCFAFLCDLCVSAISASRAVNCFFQDKG
jgi:hypothetical protein